MSHAFADTIEPSPAETPMALEIQVEVNVDFSGNVTVNQPYLRVPVNESRTVTWTLESELPGLVFDNPAITMFGEFPEVTWHPWTPNAISATFTNDIVEKQNRSFYYRVHVVQRVGETFIPFSTDPIVHNDPPPDA